MTPQKKIGINIIAITLYVLSVLFILGDNAPDMGDRFWILVFSVVTVGIVNLVISEI